MTCPCGLRPAPCPYGQRTDQVLTCPVWEKSVRPTLWERFVGFLAAFFMGRW